MGTMITRARLDKKRKNKTMPTPDVCTMDFQPRKTAAASKLSRRCAALKSSLMHSMTTMPPASSKTAVTTKGTL